MFESRNFKVFINDRAIICNGINIIEENNVSPANIFNNRNVSTQTPKGATSSKVNLNYSLSLDSTPDGLLNSALYYQTGDPYVSQQQPVILKAGNFSGSYFLTNYSFNFEPNNEIKPSCVLVSYENTSGTMSENTQSISNTLSGEYLSNTFNAQLLNYSNQPMSAAIYSLSYSVNINHSPIYCLGQKAPCQVMFNGMESSLEATHDSFSHIEFSGQTGYINDMALMKIYSTNKDLSVLASFEASIPLSGFVAKSTEIFPTNEVILNKTSFNKSL